MRYYVPSPTTGRPIFGRGLPPPLGRPVLDPTPRRRRVRVTLPAQTDGGRVHLMARALLAAAERRGTAGAEDLAAAGFDAATVARLGARAVARARAQRPDLLEGC